MLTRGWEAVGGAQLSQLALAVLVDGQDGLRATWCHLPLHHRGRLEVLKAGGLAQTSGGLLDQSTEGLLLVGPEVIARVDALSEVDASLVGTLVDTGLKGVKDPVGAPISDSSEVAI